MINREDYLMIKQAREKGCYLEDIACQRGCSVSTVKRALKRQGPPPKRRPGIRPSKLARIFHEKRQVPPNHLI
ncbi:hypothetical protein NX722_08955 [Endozoicomonas gorgoniicola]|uniref:Helix-turn-helix domain-containing protein n=1 Tax=Endozoicomonas gorgoniicola TaxID=1234144 RepID=A0ABT3MTS5_9GAMM|nr:hypothetical protein [Endozoicomonas gorgoniicola]MCW7552768.1 hypothetical protein [Endozoicomonas gorgoniicola]